MNAKWTETLHKSLRAPSWFRYVPLILVTVMAAALRFYKLGDWSFWIDEIFTIDHAISHFSTPERILENLPPSRNWVPVSVLLTAQVFNLLGVNEWSARLVAAVIGSLTVPVLYFPIRSFFNTRVALIAVLLLAVSPWHIDWSQNARGYTSLLLFSTLALFSFHRGLEKDRPAYFILFFIFLYLASSERMIALFILPALFVYLLAVAFLPLEKPAGLRARNIYILLSPGLLFAVVQVYSSVQTGQSVLGSILDEIAVTFLGKPIESPITQATFMVFKIGIPLLILSLFSLVYVWKQKNRHGVLLALTAIVPFALVVALTPLMFTEERYAFVTLPGWIVLAALGIDSLLANTKKMETFFALGILAVLVGDAMGANMLYFRVNHGNRWDYRSAFELVQANLQEGDVIVSTFSEMGNYYLKREDVLAWDDVDVQTVREAGNRVWFVVIPDMTWYTGTEDFYYWVVHETRMIRIFYLRTVDNVNLEIYLYDPAVSSQLEPLLDPAK